jgi:YkoY family integral membrane protein
MSFELLFGSDLKLAMIVILNLILVESLLSVDNAAVLATMVMKLPPEQRTKALKYGIFGAYFFRGLCLIFAAFLIQIAWLKALGGLYLLWVALKHFYCKFFEKNNEDNSHIHSPKHPILEKITSFVGPFWSTVIMVELMDLAFSIDNVFAAVALTNKIGLICLGVFIGILAMRFAAQFFVQLMQKFPALETSAFSVIGILGIKLLFSYLCDVTTLKHYDLCSKINGHEGDLVFSLVTITIFVLPLVFRPKISTID